jgi:hypothetical protein
MADQHAFRIEGRNVATGKPVQFEVLAADASEARAEARTRGIDPDHVEDAGEGVNPDPAIRPGTRPEPQPNPASGWQLIAMGLLFAVLAIFPTFAVLPTSPGPPGAIILAFFASAALNFLAITCWLAGIIRWAISPLLNQHAPSARDADNEQNEAD